MVAKQLSSFRQWRFLLKNTRKAFTIIEILISVIIISFSIVYVLKIHTQNHQQIIYIAKRNKNALQDSLFLTDEITKYHKEHKNAYELLHTSFKIDALKSRALLKEKERIFFITEPVTLMEEEEESGPSAIIQEIKLKGKYSSSYFRFKLNGF